MMLIPALKAASRWSSPPGDALVDPLPESVFGPGSGQVILAINHRRPVVDDDPFQKGVDPLPAPDGVEEVKALIDGVIRGEAAQRMIRKNLLHLPAEGAVEPEPFGPHGVFGQQKPAIREQPAQNLLFLGRETDQIHTSRIGTGRGNKKDPGPRSP